MDAKVHGLSLGCSEPADFGAAPFLRKRGVAAHPKRGRPSRVDSLSGAEEEAWVKEWSRGGGRG